MYIYNTWSQCISVLKQGEEASPEHPLVCVFMRCGSMWAFLTFLCKDTQQIYGVVSCGWVQNAPLYLNFVPQWSHISLLHSCVSAGRLDFIGMEGAFFGSKILLTLCTFVCSNIYWLHIQTPRIWLGNQWIRCDAAWWHREVYYLQNHMLYFLSISSYIQFTVVPSFSLAVTKNNKMQLVIEKTQHTSSFILKTVPWGKTYADTGDSFRRNLLTVNVATSIIMFFNLFIVASAIQVLVNELVL